ncbi:MAG: bifunctional DNA primase/polymerase [Acidimicrobiia bacterium]|nr:bifunctional DNA primase/polymerase [Acidimicrobiia bacterium]
MTTPNMPPPPVGAEGGADDHQGSGVTDNDTTGGTSVGALHGAARQYAKNQRPVFPLQPGMKVPLPGSGGFKDATTDLTQIDAWWWTNPSYNIGVATGPAGLVVVDLDVKWLPDGRPNPDHNGYTAWYRLLTDLGFDDEPHTFTVDSPTGGRHLYFLALPGRPVATSTGGTPKSFPVGIDVRAEGGYIVAAPSVRPDGGYIVDRHTEAIPFPDALADYLEAKANQPVRRRRPTAVQPLRRPRRGYGAAALADEVQRVATAPVGTRNDALNRAAFNLGQLVAGGVLEATDTANALLDAATACGLGEDEASRTVLSAFTASADQPRQVPA